MEKDPRKVAERAASKEDETWRFRTYVKMHRSPGRVDLMAAQFGREAESQMDCTTCGACCRDICVPVSPDDIARLARRLQLEPGEFAERYLKTDDDGEPAIEAKPCPFLQGNICSVYEVRPDVCRGYPYIGGNIASRMIAIIERAAVCPIVFEMLERLKDATGFRRFRR